MSRRQRQLEGRRLEQRHPGQRHPGQSRLGQSRLLIAVALSAAGACDAFSPPIGPSDFPSDFTSGIESFCPTVEFPRVDSQAALAGPLFAWVTTAERAAIEGGGPILPIVASFNPPPHEQLVGSMHGALPALPGAQALVDQPRIGRNFWTLAFAAPRASADHRQLLAIWLRPDAWLATYGSAYSVLDAQSRAVSAANVAQSPGRVAGVSTLPFPNCLREGFPEHGVVIFREEAIERVRFGSAARAHLDTDLSRLRQLLTQIRRSSTAGAETAFDYTDCGSTTAQFLCTENTFFQAISWRSPEYLPTLPAVAHLIDTLDATPVGTDFAADRMSAEDLNAWSAVWPGPWQAGGDGVGGAGGFGGAGSSEMGGAGG